MEFRTYNWLLTALQLCTQPDQTFRWHLNMGQHRWKNWKFELRAQTAFQWQLPLMSHAGEEELLSLHFPSPVIFILDLFTLEPLYWLIPLRDLTSHSIILAGQLCDILLPLPTRTHQLPEQISWIIEGDVLMHSARCSGEGLHRFPCILVSDAFQLLAEDTGAVLSIQTC